MTKKTFTLAGFEPGIYWSGGGRDDHYATPPEHLFSLLAMKSLPIQTSK
jgi:hypothetical protein